VKRVILPIYIILESVPGTN